MHRAIPLHTIYLDSAMWCQFTENNHMATSYSKITSENVVIVAILKSDCHCHHGTTLKWPCSQKCCWGHVITVYQILCSYHQKAQFNHVMSPTYSTIVIFIVNRAYSILVWCPHNTSYIWTKATMAYSTNIQPLSMVIWSFPLINNSPFKLRAYT